MINMQQMDALEFVKPLKGNWDVINFDPPYMNSLINTTFDYEKEVHRELDWESSKEYQHRIIIDPGYIQELRNLITSKTDNYIWFEFNKNYDPQFTHHFLWYKGKQYGSMGMGYVRQNASWVGFNLHGTKKPALNNGNAIYPFKVVEEYPYNHQTMKALEIPQALLEKMLLFADAHKVLDPFGGSWVMAKACNKLGIDLDICDKFEPVINLNKKGRRLL